jgi:hypothetical protein
MVIWYIFHVLVCLDQDKSGNPVARDATRHDSISTPLVGEAAPLGQTFKYRQEVLIDLKLSSVNLRESRCRLVAYFKNVMFIILSLGISDNPHGLNLSHAEVTKNT